MQDKIPKIVVNNSDSEPLPQVNFSPRVSQLDVNSGESYRKQDVITETPPDSYITSKA